MKGAAKCGWLLAPIGLLFTSQVDAAALQVAPTTVEIAAPGAASVLTLRNGGSKPITAQVRVFRWSEKGGQTELQPATEVVVSPPMVSISAGGEHLVRVVRTARTPVSREESYRLLVDEIPDPSARASGRVNLAIRYSIPVFFTPAEAGSPQLQWSIVKSSGQTLLKADNGGTRRVRLSSVQVQGSNGQPVLIQKGLAGYVLPGSSLLVPLSGSAEIATGRDVRVSAQTENGTVSGTVRGSEAR